MMIRFAVLLLFLGSWTLEAAAQAHPESGIRAEFLHEWEALEQKVVGLAEAIPAEQYSWRPSEGVRSISEALLHIAAGNYNLPRRLGAESPEGFQARGYDTSMTEKSDVVTAVRASFDHVRRAVLNMQDSEAEDTFDWFGGRQNTKRGLLTFLNIHASEHLGQLIAYARMNDIVPPWSQ